MFIYFFRFTISIYIDTHFLWPWSCVNTYWRRKTLTHFIFWWCLPEVLYPYLPSSPRCLELFARNLWPNWTSWGREVSNLKAYIDFDEFDLWIDERNRIMSVNAGLLIFSETNCFRQSWNRSRFSETIVVCYFNFWWQMEIKQVQHYWWVVR